MQLVSMLRLVDVALPSNVQQVFEMIDGLVNFQFFDTTSLDLRILHFNRSDPTVVVPLNEAFQL